MNRQHYQRVKAAFLEVSALPPDEREAVLARLRDSSPELLAQLERLLEADERGDASLPERIGGYRIEAVLGRGGMGVVYRAIQENPLRAIALKVLAPVLATPVLLQRFQREAQLLGRLKHPGIAQIHEARSGNVDAGEMPYLAMELVEGLSLTEHARAEKLSTRQRIELLVKVCEAVEHAHAEGIVHRDLKPANILVQADGQPKVLDFGIARLTDADLGASPTLTHQGEFLGTLAYMSPEQARGRAEEVDARSDVYSLGIVAFELFAGRLPDDFAGRSLTEAMRMIQVNEAPQLGSLDRSLRGDVETVVAKALEKERERRYQSAADLRQDLQRILRDEPITARPASKSYQLRKLARRHKGLVLASAAILLALCLGLIGTLRGLSEAVDERDRAREETARAEAESEKAMRVVEFLQDMLARARPSESRGAALTVAEILDEAARLLDQARLEEPTVEVALRTTIGSAQLALDRYPEAERHLARALELSRKTHGEDHLDTAACWHWWGSLMIRLSRYDQAEQALARALSVRRRQQGPEHESVVQTRFRQAQLLHHLGRHQEAEQGLREVLALRRARHGAKHEEVAAVQGQLARLLNSTGRYEEAEALFREVVATQEQVFGGPHPALGASLNNLAALLHDRGRLNEAKELYERSLAMSRALDQAKSLSVSSTLSNLAIVYQDQLDNASARRLLREALSIRRALQGDSHPSLAPILQNLGVLAESDGLLREAEGFLREALSLRIARYGEQHAKVAGTLISLSSTLSSQGRTAEAEEASRRAWEMHRTLMGEEHPDTLLAQLYHGKALLLCEQEERGLEQITRALDGCEMELGEEHSYTLYALEAVGQARMARQDFHEAESLFLQMHERAEEVAGERGHHARSALQHLVTLYARWGKPDEAQDWRLRLAESAAPRSDQ